MRGLFVQNVVLGVAVDKSGCRIRQRWKKAKKRLKKVLTKRDAGDIINKLSRRADRKGSKNGSKAHWKLNNKHHIKSTKVDVYRDSEILLKNKKENSKQVKSKKDRSDEKMITEGDFGWHTNIREFDPGSGWTLAACITHSSRTVKFLRKRISGGRVSNAWATCLLKRDNTWKRVLIPHEAWPSHGGYVKGLPITDGLALD